MNKKKILIMTHSFPIGGIESALIAMLNCIDYRKTDVTLLLVSKEGERLSDVPKEVRLFALSEKERIYLDVASYSFKCLKRGAISKAVFVRLTISGIFKVAKRINWPYNPWKHQSRYIHEIEGIYDVAIDYSGFFGWFLLDKVNAQKKIIWNHFDYRKFDISKDLDREMFSRFSNIVSVSENGAETLREYFPEYGDKIVCMHNLIDYKRIDNLSEEQIDDLPGEKNCLKLCTLARLQAQKNISLSIRAAALMRDKGINFIWYILGDGTLREQYENEIRDKSLEGVFLLLGKRDNPYPYLKHCDIYVQNSEYEGLSVAVQEARYLKKPMVVTNVQGLRELVEDGVTGYIVEQDEKSLADAIERLANGKIEMFSQAIKQNDAAEESMRVWNSLIGYKKDFS